MRLDTTSAAQTATDEFQNTEPTVDEISIGTDGAVNGTSMVAYCFADVKGFSKFGSYTGNGNANGTFVYTGFKPAFVIIKNASSAQSWYMHDNARNPTNDMGKTLWSDLSDAEETNHAIDFLSNGFKTRANGLNQQDSGSHIHLHGICRTTFRNFNNQWFYTSDSEMITFILGLLIGYFGKEHITALLIKAKDKISEYFSK
jgi:hypothetical protein